MLSWCCVEKKLYSYFCTMFSLLIVLFVQLDSVKVAPHLQDSIQSDTLREVTVLPLRRLPIEQAIDESLKRYVQPSVPTLSDILEKIKPGLNDIITHPFAFKQRKREKRKRRTLKILEDYNRMRTFEELVREAYEQQLREDSLLIRDGQKVVR